MNKVLKVFVIILLSILIIIGLVFGGIFTNNKIKLGKESVKISEYGQRIKVGEKEMQVSILGQGDDTLVLLPGYLTGAPTLDFKLLTDELSIDHKVVVIEPLGYGMSDDTDAPRTVENLVNEVHSALDSLDIKEYSLVTHSIWGVYALKYIEMYPNEVNLLVGIDSSLPSQGGADDNQESMINFLAKSGIYRILSSTGDDFLNTPPMDEEFKQQFKYISLHSIGSKATQNEGYEMKNNFDKTMNSTYPIDLPVLYILASESVESDSNWIPIHEAMLENSSKSKLIVLEGSHYLHHTQSKTIASELNNFSN
ncbi:alpha/beta hydrolase [Erysipelothrix inopinata]|uniref:Alpha/beta hydrolase n=1 Tax=Erysipelothrix inopinata TaxID=225084 RepID=A0A7G9S185_9FIRM|nr:alpha/beta hydrolase [Erysipelothrix inopinata]QNN61610.1 alpha/beta hydrolase [Erysipelothrix inopinata]